MSQRSRASNSMDHYELGFHNFHLQSTQAWSGASAGIHRVNEIVTDGALVAHYSRVCYRRDEAVDLADRYGRKDFLEGY